MSLTKLSYAMIQGAPVNVLDFMTDAQKINVISNIGTIDVSDAIQAAIDSLGNIGTSTGGGTVFFPKGTYLCHININGTNNNSMGEYGIKLSGYGATLKGRATDTSIIQINNAVAGTADPDPTLAIYANGTVIEGFNLDMSLMSNLATNYAIASMHMYNSALRDLYVIYEPALGGGLFLGGNIYTTQIDSLACARVKIEGTSSTYSNTTIVFNNLIANQVIMKHVFSISFFGGVLQGTQDHFVMEDDCQAITVMGVDLETTGGYIYNFGTNCRYITSIGNACGGGSLSTYSTGLAVASNLSDRPPISGVTGGSIGNYSRVASQGMISVNASTVTITIASPGVVSWASHGLNNGDTVKFSTTGALPTGLTAGTTYYVVNKTTNSFQVSTTSGGAAVNTSGTQSGVQTAQQIAPLYYFKDSPTNQNIALVMVLGDNGSNGFQDLIMVFATFVTVIKSQDLYGTAPTRSYTAGSNILNMTVSTGSYNIRPVVTEYLANA